MYIFLSHSSSDSKITGEICSMLEKRGHQCFLAPRDIRSGHEYAEEIIEGIERSDVVLLLLSEAANQSPHVLREIERAVSKKIKIIVYKLEPVELSKSMEYFLMAHQWVDTKSETGMEAILKSLEELPAQDASQNHQEKQNKKAKPEKGSGRMAGKAVGTAALLVVLLAIIIACTQAFPKASDTNVPEKGQQSQATEEAKVSLGDTIVFGTYQGEPIEWRVIKLSDDKTEAVVIAQNILTMKAYDAAESGKYNYYEGNYYWTENVKEFEAELQHLLRGNNRWSDSNIRTWLNSSKENVTYNDQAPTATAMSELLNGYDTEPGFLNGFSEEELEAIVTTNVVTGGITTEDKVFLLSSAELLWLDEADVSRMAVPSETALEQDKSGWYQMLSLDCGVEDYYWWLRDTDTTEETSIFYEAYIVGNSYNEGNLLKKSVGLEGFGIRPAMTVDVTADCVVKDGERK